MSNCFRLQDDTKNRRTVGTYPVGAVLRKMQTHGVTICGIGVANLPLLSLLPAHGFRLLSVRDRRPPTPEVLSAIRATGAHALFGEGYLAELEESVIFRTPSLRPDTPALAAARARGAIVLTEVALFLALCPAELFAVTGSDGKTTTAMMTEALLRTAGRRTHLGGNIGRPLLADLPTLREGDAVIVELSSFQLADLDPPRGRCAITGITENHLDWHTDMAEYTAAKARILGGGTAVLNADCARTAALATPNDVRITLGQELPGEGPAILLQNGTVIRRDRGERVLFPASALRLPGRYNLSNAMTAAALVGDAVPTEAIAPALAAFRGAPHRTEYLGRYQGVACYDSSIDTTPARTAATLSAFSSRPIVLLGGRGKNLSFLPLADSLLQYAGGAILTGECADEIEKALRQRDPDGRLPTVKADDFLEAVRAGLRLASPGGTLLLSPAATSFDRFTDYAARGAAFAAALAEERRE